VIPDNRKEENIMKNLSTLASAFVFAALLFPGIAAAADDPAVDDGAASAASDATANDDDYRSPWSINFTPVLILPKDEYRWGGGADPELKYTFDLGGAYLSAGGRVGAYYAKNLFGTMAMPTLRVMVPIGPVEPYVSLGAGYGWLPKVEHEDIAAMARLGTVVRFSKKLAIGIEGTLQGIHDSDFLFPSFGSMVSFDL
jgi:hypothetical protein